MLNSSSDLTAERYHGEGAQICAKWGAESHLDIHTIESALKQLKSVLSGVQHLTIDLSGVVSIDTAGVQLLLVLAKDLKGQGRPLHCAGRSAVVDDAFKALGFNAGITLGVSQ